MESDFVFVNRESEELAEVEAELVSHIYLLLLILVILLTI